MPLLIFFIKRFSCVALVCCCCGLVAVIHAQQQPSPKLPSNVNQTPPQQTSTEQSEDVIRINTNLVQTDVTVLDKSGRFVDKLGREQFQLLVDGKLQPLAFFERVTAGSVNEDAQIAAARGVERSSKNTAGVRPLDRGRVVFFFVDDLHLSFDSLGRTRKTIQRFIDDELGQNDQALIVSATGQTGFLGQLTNNKAVLRAALARISFQDRSTRDSERPPMSEYQALAVSRRDRDAVDYFVDAVLRDNPGLSRDAAENMVNGRANQTLERTSYLTASTLLTLDGIVRSLSKLQGRKIGFFMSDGFFLDTDRSNVIDRLRHITDGAARNGTVLYTMDTRGLSTGLPDASSDAPSDPTGRLARVGLGEISASQNVFYTLAAETGGRALVNTNALGKVLTRTLQETSVYYLLAWQPPLQSDERANNRFRTIKVSIKDHPEWTVLARRGFSASPTPEPIVGKRDKKKNKTGAAEKTPDDELRATLNALYARTELPVAVSLGYTDVPGTGTVLTAVTQINDDKPNSSAESAAIITGAAQTGVTDVISVVFDDQGKPVSSLKDRITAASGKAKDSPYKPVLFTHRFQVAPGLYQVRVAARENETGRTGSAIQWIEIPKIAQGGFALGSVFVGERPAIETKNTGATADPTASLPVIISADHRFARSSYLRFLTFIYNAALRPDKSPDVALQVQIFRDDQPIITAPLSKLKTAGITDLTRIPYAAEITLSGIPIGQYVLQVTAIDRAAKVSASQRINFTVE